MDEIYKVKWEFAKGGVILNREKFFKNKEKANDFAGDMRLAWAKLEGLSTDFKVDVIRYELEDMV